MLTCVILTDQQFTEQPNCQHLNASYDQHTANHKQRSMLIHDIGMRLKNLHPQQHRRDQAAHHDAQHTEPAKKVHWTAHVSEKEPNCHEIEEDAERPSDSIVAPAPLTVHIPDGNFADRCAIPTGQRRDEPVHLPVERNVLDHFTAISLESRAKVVDVYAREPGHEPVRAVRWKPPQHQVVNPDLAPAGDNVVSLFELFNEAGDIIRVMLQVPVHGEDKLARCMVETGCQSRGLTEVPAKLHHQHAAVYRCNLLKELVGPIAGPVIDQHQLKIITHLLHNLLQASV